MESGGPAFDFSDTEVFFSSYDALVPFKNPSNAAIARLSVQKGFTFGVVQAVLDLIVFNPSFNSREVTLTSAGSIDEAVAKQREAQVLRRESSGGTEMASGNGATSPLAISLVVSQIKQYMVPFSSTIALWRRYDRNLEPLLMAMSLVHRSWTMPAQELLFQRMFGTIRRNLIRPLLQHPFCSRIQELHLEVGCMSDDDLDRFALFLLRLSSLRKLSLAIWIEEDSVVDRDNICAKIYSEIAQRLPNLAELWIDHPKFALLEDCVRCVLQGKSGAAPFVMKDFLITDRNLVRGYEFQSVMLLSPAKACHHETSYYPSTYSSPQAHNSGDISTCSVTIAMRNKPRFLGPLLSRFFDTGGVFGDICPQICHFTFYPCIYSHRIGVDPFLVSFLRRCTSLEHMNLFCPEFSRQEMTNIPFSRVSETLQVLSIHFLRPVKHNAQERASELEYAVRAMCDRVARSSLERIEVNFYGDANEVVMRSLQPRSIKTALPDYLSSVHKMCHELHIDFVCKTVE